MASSQARLQREWFQAGAGKASIENITDTDCTDDYARFGWRLQLSCARFSLDCFGTDISQSRFDPDTIVPGGALPDTILADLVERISLMEHATEQRKDRRIP